MTRSSCQHVQEQLLDLAGTSVPREAGALRDHLDSCPACKAYWAALCADDALLCECVDALQPAVARIEEGVLRQLAQVQQESSVSAPHRLMPAGGWDAVRTQLLRLPLLRNPRTALAAAAVLVLALYLLFGRGRATPYERVMGALGEVSTVHLVDATLRDGRWEKETELWYDREAGVAATVWQDGQATAIRIDNSPDPIGKADSGLGRPRPGTRALRVVADLLQTGLFTRDFVRVPQEDRAVGAMPCRAYSLSDGTGSVRLLAWLDDARRVRAWEKRRLSKDGAWETYRTGTIEYDVTPDPALFQPGFAPDVNIVDVDPAR